MAQESQRNSTCTTTFVKKRLDTTPEAEVVENPEQLISVLGGCGRFQIRISILVHLTKTFMVFSQISMILISYTPSWTCADELPGTPENVSGYSGYGGKNKTTYSKEKNCLNWNDTKCQSFVYDGRSRTLVTEVFRSNKSCKYFV